MGEAAGIKKGHPVERFLHRYGLRGNSFMNLRGIIILLGLCLFLLPVFYILKVGIGSWGSEGDLWSHLYETMLPLYIRNTLILMVGAGGLSSILGLISAWSITYYGFPTRGLLVWVMFLPFAFPTYLIAYIYTDLLDYPGPLQSALRSGMGWGPQDYWFPEIRSLPGAILLFAVNLYPYVYMFARKAFLEQSNLFRQVAQVFGLGPRKIFFLISWPLTRPAIIVGIFLVMMETLADFGAVNYFSIPTLSLGAYNFWINMGSLEGAIQIAIITLGVIMIMVVLEKWQRSRKRHVESHAQPLVRKKLPPFPAVLLMLFNWGLVSLGFIIPLLVLLRYSFLSLTANHSDTTVAEYLTYSWNSFSLALTIALLTTAIAFLIIKAVVTHKSSKIKSLLPIFSIGYALPGTILGIGIIPVVMQANQVIGDSFFIGGTLLAVMYAYVIRFITIPIGSIETGHKKISENIYHSAKILGKGRWERVVQIDIPLMKKCLLTSFVIVFVDVMKELPLMIMLRPLNYDNLVTHVFTYASDENLVQASLSALTIVLLGVLPIIVFNRSIDRSRMSVEEITYWKR